MIAGWWAAALSFKVQWLDSIGLSHDDSAASRADCRPCSSKGGMRQQLVCQLRDAEAFKSLQEPIMFIAVGFGLIGNMFLGKGIRDP